MDTFGQAHPIVVAVAIASGWMLLGAGVIFAVLSLISVLSGWRSLASRFSLQGEFPQERWKNKSAQMKAMLQYNNCVTIGANTAGLYLCVPRPMAWTNPPLFIPWNEISYSRAKILWRPVVRFQLGRDDSVPFTVREELADNIRMRAGSSWPAEKG
jgi:hypothetical protein